MARGLLRLWVLLSAVWVAALLVLVVEYVFVREPCYKFLTVSRGIPSITPENFAATEKDAMSREFCGADNGGTLLNLESLAKRGEVVQVAIAWREPRGWSDELRGEIDVFEQPEITVAEIQNRAATSVRSARVGVLQLPFLVGLTIPFVVFAIGYSVRWVVQGFRKAS